MENGLDDTNNALEVEWVEIDAVFPNPANPRQNDEAVEWLGELW